MDKINYNKHLVAGSLVGLLVGAPEIVKSISVSEEVDRQYKEKLKALGYM